MVIKQFVGLACFAPAWLALAAGYQPDHSVNLGFPIYTNQPLGRQVQGAHAAATAPALSPEDSRQQFRAPPGFEVRLFAAEPWVVNPVAMTWDDRGRLWVVELYEYPSGAPKGQRPRDRIKILEDTDADGRADKVTVFADGFSLATGILLGNGGVYLGAAPDLLFLEDTDRDGRADKQRVLKTGFGLQDRHEMLNSFAWGPDGWLYLTHGVFTHSKVRDPNDPADDGVRMDAAVARYQPRTRQFEVVADGTSNPWGVDWNERGDPFVSACVIHHLFHMAPGGQYNRQGGTWANPYGYLAELPSQGLPAVVDWRHYRAAHAGVCIYQGDQFPPEWRGLVLLGNIHQNAINCDRLIPTGATYRAEKESRLLGPDKGHTEVGAGNFLVSHDPWFRPVSLQVGPDGALWVMDWCDRYPCYQNAVADPNGVDRELGRIWRVVWVGNQPGKPVPSRPKADMDLAKEANLAPWLAHPNVWQRRQAQRLFAETRTGTSEAKQLLAALKQSLSAGAGAPGQPWSLDHQQAVISGLYASGDLDAETLDLCARQSDAGLRQRAARLTGERQQFQAGDRQRLIRLSEDPEPAVRAAVASALRQFSSGALTVDTPPTVTVDEAEFITVLRGVLARPSVAEDLYYPHIAWMAMEPRVARDPKPYFALLAEAANSVTAWCVERAMRRVCDQAEPDVRARQLDLAVEFLGQLSAQPVLAAAALDGFLAAYKTKGLTPSVPVGPVLEKLYRQPGLAEKARRLGVLWGDQVAAREIIASGRKSDASRQARLEAIAVTRRVRLPEAMDFLTGTVAGDADQSLRVEALRALGEWGEPSLPALMLKQWRGFAPATRRAATEVLVSRTEWARALLAALAASQVAQDDLSATVIRALATHREADVRAQAEKIIGKYRAPAEDKLQLIAQKRKVVLEGKPDLTAGYDVAKRTCLVCHKLYGEGAEVGPDLTGVGRSTLDALLANVIDPNQIIGEGYQATEIELKDDQVLSGRIVAETPTTIKLLSQGPVEHNLAKSDIVSDNGKLKIRSLGVSVMPDGLEQMPDADFRNLIWFILNPPGDQRPLTAERRRELLGE